MTDTFLDDHATLNLTRQLRELAGYLPQVLAIARREVSPPGGRAARNPTVPGSRPPMNLGALDSHHDVTISLQGWTRVLNEDAHVPLPTEVDAPSLARHLARHAHQMAQQTWAEDCADEIGDHHRRVRGLVDPTPSRLGPDHVDQDTLHAHADEAIGPAADMVVLHFALTGESLKESTLRSWRKRGKFTERYGCGGEPVYLYPAVAEVAAEQREKNRRRKV